MESKKDRSRREKPGRVAACRTGAEMEAHFELYLCPLLFTGRPSGGERVWFELLWDFKVEGLKSGPWLRYPYFSFSDTF